MANDNLLEIKAPSQIKRWNFQAGNSGGPGRHKHLWSKEVKRYAFRKAIAVQWACMMNKNAKDSDRYNACVFIAGYAAGKPLERIQHDVIGDVEKPNTLQIVLNITQDDANELTIKQELIASNEDILK